MLYPSSPPWNVPAALPVRSPPPAAPPSPEQVEARYGGKGKWYGGEVTGDNGDGTYAVAYDDGDDEAAVAFLRRPS